VNAEFNWWLLIVGLVVGAGLVWFVVMDSRRREEDIDAHELPREAAWLSAQLAEDGFDVPPEATERLLLLHRDYLGAPPPDEPLDEPSDDEGLSPDPEPEPEPNEAPPAERAEPTAERAEPTTDGRPPRRGRQRRPTSTGSASSATPSTSAIETPNVDPAGSDATAGTSPTQ
jgi:outer membrane biosynthesis protein TonB